MLPACSKIIQSLPGDKPQCYKTAYEVFDKMVAIDIPNYKKKVVDEKDLNGVLAAKGDFVSVVEIYIAVDAKLLKSDPVKIRAKYQVTNSFWIPRVFIHAFNIIAAGDYVDVWQSWDKVSDYAHIWRFPRAEFPKWIARVQSAIKHYGEEPQNLFELFEYDSIRQHVHGLPPISLLYNMIKGERFKCVPDTIVKTVFVTSK